MVGINYEKIINEKVEMFIDNIAKELEEKHSKWFDDFGFPLFGNVSDEYHEQVYFQSYLEAYTRIMINGILYDLLYEWATTEYKWPEFEYPGIYRGYTNAECEEKFDFEFIDEDRKIGYRYNYIYPNDLIKLIEKSKLNRIIIVDWSYGEESPSIHYGDDRFELISVHELFLRLFKELEEDEIIEKNEIQELYDYFVQSIMDAVHKAVEMISLKTIPGFTPAYLHDFRKTVINDIESKAENDIIFRVKNRKYKINQEKSQQLIKQYDLHGFFIKHKLHYALVGNSDYAKSFLTSEYLYQYFENNSLFDYTPIVSGYLKSIEQLMHVICLKYSKAHNVRTSFKNVGLGFYINFLKDETKKDVFREEIRSDRQIIIDCLDSYRIENRNRLFHKDYFNKWSQVTRIRENTIFLYIALLSAVDLELINKDGGVLALLDDNYERLYNIFSKYKSSTFTIVFENRRYHSMKIISKIREGLRYDAQGVISNKLEFKRDDCFYDDEEYLTITNKNVPKEVWIEEIGKIVKKIW